MINLHLAPIKSNYFYEVMITTLYSFHLQQPNTKGHLKYIKKPHLTQPTKVFKFCITIQSVLHFLYTSNLIKKIKFF